MTIVLHRPEARFHVEPLCWQLPESEIAKPPPDGSGIVLPLAAYCAQVDQWMLIPPGAPDAPGKIWSVMLDGVEPMQVTVGTSSLHFGVGPATAVAALRSVIPRRTVQANREIFSVESGHGDSSIFDFKRTGAGGRDGRKQAKVCASLSVHSMQSGPFHRGGGHGRLAGSPRSVKEDNGRGAGVNRSVRAAPSSVNPAVGRAPASRSVSRHARLRCGLGGPARAGFGVSTWTDVGPAEFPWFQPLARVIIVARD